MLQREPYRRGDPVILKGEPMATVSMNYLIGNLCCLKYYFVRNLFGRGVRGIDSLSLRNS